MRGLHFMNKYLNDLMTISCPVCLGTDFISLGNKSRGGLALNSVICHDCSLIFLNPKPSAEHYALLYSSGDYRRFLNTVKGRKVPEQINNYLSDEKFHKRREYGRAIAKKYFKNILKNGDLYFDFGCDSGGVMAGVRQETGCRIMGNEPSSACADIVKEKLGITVLSCLMEDIGEHDRALYRGKVKLASLVHVLEHVNDPVACLDVAYKMLADEGYLYVEGFDIIKRMEQKKESVSCVATIDHQCYFHKEVYLHMLRSCGFEPLEFNYSDSNPRIMQVLASKNPGRLRREYDVAAIVEKVMQLNKEGRGCHYGLPSLFKNNLGRIIHKSRRLSRKAMSIMERHV